LGPDIGLPVSVAQTGDLGFVGGGEDGKARDERNVREEKSEGIFEIVGGGGGEGKDEWSLVSDLMA